MIMPGASTHLNPALYGDRYLVCLVVTSTAMAFGLSLSPTINKWGLPPPTPSVDSLPTVPLPVSVKYNRPRDESSARDETELATASRATSHRITNE